MAGLAVIFFYTSRLVLPLTWSIVIALGGALGTQIFSTASRVLWTIRGGVSAGHCAVDDPAQRNGKGWN